MLDTNMLSTNEIQEIAHAVGSAAGGFVSEIVSGILLVALPFVIQLWRKARIKQAVINVLVRGVVKSANAGVEGDTAFLNKSVTEEAKNANMEKHVDQAVKQVTAKMAEEEHTNGRDGGHI